MRVCRLEDREWPRRELHIRGSLSRRLRVCRLLSRRLHVSGLLSSRPSVCRSLGCRLHVCHVSGGRL